MKGALNHLKLLDQNGTFPKHGFPQHYGMHDVDNLCKIVQDCWQLSKEPLHVTNSKDDVVEDPSVYDKDPCVPDENRGKHKFRYKKKTAEELQFN